jgi:hypothetical protein
MKAIRSRLAIVCSLLLAFALTSAAAGTAVPVTARFSPHDMAISYVYAGETRDEAAAVFGDPARSEYMMSEATGETSELWFYDGLTLTFSEEGKLIGAETDDTAFVGPRGVAVGQTPEDVIGRFYVDPDLDSDTVLYTSGYVEFTETQFPPCGYVRSNDDGTFFVIYVAPDSPFGGDVLSDPMDFVYEPLATFVVNFGADETVTDYSWNLGPWAE